MEENDMKQLSTFLKDAEVKVVWREEERTKVGRGKICMMTITLYI